MNTAPAMLAIDSCTGVLLVTNTESDDHPAAADAAARLAARCDVPILFYDRSEETWGDSQHPEGPMKRDDPRLEDRPKLCAQMGRAEELGAQALGWVSTLPSISAVLSALGEVGADVIVVPKELDQRLLERALSGDSLADMVRQQIDQHGGISATVIEIDTAGDAKVQS